jgi:outer membrane protein assembly factor BamD (BamD/ComL family)
MKEVMKKFPGSRWADLAAFHLIDNKLCGDWQSQSKCPEKEADIYEKYANEHPQSPNLAEALFEAAYRRSALIEIYKSEDQGKRAAESRTKAVALAQKIIAQSPQSDWGARAQRLLYLMEQQIPTYGNALE